MVTCRPFAMIRQATDDEVRAYRADTPRGYLRGGGRGATLSSSGYYPPGV